jgi:hypothetical protein
VVQKKPARGGDSQVLVLVQNQQAQPRNGEELAPWGVWGARPPKIMTDDVVRAFRGHTSPEDVDLIGALSHPSPQVERLLAMADTK